MFSAGATTDGPSSYRKNLSADSIRIREAALEDSAGNRTQANSAFHTMNATPRHSLYEHESGKYTRAIP